MFPYRRILLWLENLSFFITFITTMFMFAMLWCCNVVFWRLIILIRCCNLNTLFPSYLVYYLFDHLCYLPFCCVCELDESWGISITFSWSCTKYWTLLNTSQKGWSRVNDVTFILVINNYLLHGKVWHVLVRKNDKQANLVGVKSSNNYIYWINSLRDN